VVEFREKLDVKNAGPVEDESRLEVVVPSSLVLVAADVLEIGVVSLPELVLKGEVVSFALLFIGAELVSLSGLLVLGAEDVSFGALPMLGVFAVSVGKLELDVEGASLGASSPETSLTSPETAEPGSPVTTPGMPESPSEADNDNDKDNAKSGEAVVATLAGVVLLVLVLEPASVDVASEDVGTDDMAVSWRGSSIRWPSMPPTACWTNCASSKGSTTWA
jgi:hypothetical protein